MGSETIGIVFGVSAMLTVIAFWLHARLASGPGRPGPVSMVAFVLGWLGALTAVLTGTFLLAMAMMG